MNATEFLWFLAHNKATKWEGINFITLCQLLFARGRYKPEYFLHYIRFTLNFFILKQTVIIKILGQTQICLVLLFGKIYQRFTFFANGLPILHVFVLKNNAVQCHLYVKWCHLIWVTLSRSARSIRLYVLRSEGKNRRTCQNRALGDTPF